MLRSVDKEKATGPFFLTLERLKELAKTEWKIFREVDVSTLFV